MILCFISVGFIILSIVFFFLSKKADKKSCLYYGKFRESSLSSRPIKETDYYQEKYLKLDSFSDSFLIGQAVTGTIGAVLLFSCIFCLFIGHVEVSLNIEKANITYESLCKKLEVAQSGYEDISKTEVIDEIEKWNKAVVEDRYFAKSPWTNWFYSQERVNNLKLIEY